MVLRVDSSLDLPLECMQVRSSMSLGGGTCMNGRLVGRFRFFRHDDAETAAIAYQVRQRGKWGIVGGG